MNRYNHKLQFSSPGSYTCQQDNWSDLAWQFEQACQNAARRWKDTKLPSKPPKEALELWATTVNSLWLGPEATEVRRILKEAWEGKPAVAASEKAA